MQRIVHELCFMLSSAEGSVMRVGRNLRFEGGKTDVRHYRAGNPATGALAACIMEHNRHLASFRDRRASCRNSSSLKCRPSLRETRLKTSGRSKARNIRNRRSSLRHRSRSRRSIRFRSLNLSRRRIRLHRDSASINSHISRSSLMATHSLQGRCRELTT